ncbi:MAG: PEP-CTERM sorting domain-containing protein [Caulobacteraceae bacterium]
MARKTLLIAAAAAALGVIAVPALADNIVQGVWYSAYFGETGSPVTGPGANVGTNPSGVLAPAGTTWTITLGSAESLTVVDVEDSGDQFQIFDNGASLGNTTNPTVGDSVGECISCALANTDFSRGVFYLGPGTNVINMTFLGSIGTGDVDFYVGAPQTGVPEAATWALMLAGFAGLGAALRGRRKALAAPA